MKRTNGRPQWGLPFCFGGLMVSKALEEELDRVKNAMGEMKEKYMRPSQCRSHMRQTLAREFQGIVEGFVAAAKKGSCPHVKLATELLKPTRKSPSRRKGSAMKLLEKINQELSERERLQKEALEAK